MVHEREQKSFKMSVGANLDGFIADRSEMADQRQNQVSRLEWLLCNEAGATEEPSSTTPSASDGGGWGQRFPG